MKTPSAVSMRLIPAVNRSNAAISVQPFSAGQGIAAKLDVMVMSTASALTSIRPGSYEWCANASA